jgi:tetratricopeptide (TPR) repeat protein
LFRNWTFILWFSAGAALTFGQTEPPWKSLSWQAKERYEADDFGAAESLRREALRLAEERLGPTDKALAPLLANLALSLHFEARGAEADPLVRRALAIAEESGDRHLTGIMLNTLGVVLSGEREFARAEPLLRRSVAVLEEAEGADSFEAAQAANNLATIYADTRQYLKAEEVFSRVLPIFEKRLGSEDPLYAMALSSMFNVLYKLHRAQEGEPYLRRALAIGERKFPGTLKMANLEHCLAALEESRQNYNEAARLLEKVMATEERLLGPDHPALAQSLLNYSEVLRHLHQKGDAKQAVHRANAILNTLR